MNGEFESKEIIESQPQDLAVDAIKYAEKRLEHLKKFIGLALTITNPHDWTIIEGQPYLEISGSQKIARLFGVCWRDVKKNKEDKTDSKGSYYVYSYTGTFFLAGHEDESVEFLGTCSSRDKFFGTKGGELKDVDDVDELNIMKKAWTNLLNRGIKGLLGLNNLTADMLKNAGLDMGKSSSVTYGKGTKGGTSKAKVKSDMANKIKAMCLFLANGDQNKAGDYYHKEPGKADFEIEEDGKKKLIIAKEVNQLSEKHANKIYGNLKKEFEKLNLDLSVAFHEYGVYEHILPEDKDNKDA